MTFQDKQQPRRILEKSRTVRRRYQRSNQRFQFTASQIGRIEREEEREKRAKQIREREKRKLLNKKKKAEKEAKEREERRRLGSECLNTINVPASQPLLARFFGAKRCNTVDANEQSIEDKARNSEESSQEAEASESDEELEKCAENGPNEDGISPIQVENGPSQFSDQQQQASTANDTTNCVSDEFSDLETELGDDWLDDPTIGAHLGDSNTSSLSADKAQIEFRCPPAKGVAVEVSAGQNSICQSFEDDTSHLLQTLDPSILQDIENSQSATILRDVNEAKIMTTSSVARAAADICNVNARNFASPGKKSHRDDEEYCRSNTYQAEFAISDPAKQKILEPQHSRITAPQRATVAHEHPITLGATGSVSNSTSVNGTVVMEMIEKPRPMGGSPHAQRPLQFELHKSPGQAAKTRPGSASASASYSNMENDAEDDFDDLFLSTQDLRQIDSMVGLG